MTQETEGTRIPERHRGELEGPPAKDWDGPLKLLFATDGSDEAKAAERLLQRLPLAAGSTVYVLTVTAGAEWTLPDWFVAGEHAWGETVAAATAESLERPRVETVPAARSGAVAFEIIEAADEYDVDLVVVGSKGLTGLKGFFLGSVARNVAKHVRRSVLVARELRNELRRVVLAVDESPHAADAARLAARLPLPEETVLQVVHVLRPYQPYGLAAPEFAVQFEEAVREARKQQQVDADALVHDLCRRLEARGKRAEPLVLTGDPADELLRLASESGADLVIAGARGVSLIEGLLVGSVADRLLKQASSSVLLVR